MADEPRTARVGAQFVDRLPAALDDWTCDNLAEPVWGAIETGTDREEGDVWLVVGATRNALAAAGPKGRFWLDLPEHGATSRQTRLAWEHFYVDGNKLFEAGRLGNSRLQRLFDLAFLPRSEGLLEAARDHMARDDWQNADDLLTLAERAVTPEDAQPNVAYLNRAQHITLEQAACAMHLGHEGDTLVMLAAVSDDRPGDDLLRATERHHATEGWLLTLALAHQEAGQPEAAAQVYARMSTNDPDEDLLILARARALRRADKLEDAALAYESYLDRHLSDEVMLREDGDAKSDFVAACVESAEVLETLGRPEIAASRYVALIRRAPLESLGYDRLFALQGSLDGADDILGLAFEILRTLNPAAAATLAQTPTRREPIELPYSYGAIDDDQHARFIIHAAERDSSKLAQKWLGTLTLDERDTRDIERHAQRVDGASQPSMTSVIEKIAALAGVEVPRVYLSHGSSGIEVLGARDPFILLGACHLDPADSRCLPLREMAFAAGTQIEHIRANHVLLTSSEFWRTFGTKSATALLAFVPLGDLVGKLTDGSIMKWVNKLGGKSSGGLRTALELAERRIAEGATGQSVQTAYTATLAKVRSVALEPEPDQASLVKERLADFARAAQYTADRVGLLAADDIGAAVSAMVRLSPSLHVHGEALAASGFVGLCAAAGEDPAVEDLTLRVGELLKFMLSASYQEMRASVIDSTN